MQIQNKNKTVVVGMSGGVDSSVSALILKEQGYNVIGLFMQNWEEKDENGNCSALDDYEDVKRVCDKIGIPYYTVNFSNEYNEKVFKDFISEIKKGRTPNPDVLCNREIKFGPFLDYAKKIGADYIATGHYCRKKNMKDEILLMKGVDKNKDQSYFLNQLSSKQLSMVLFPIGDLRKDKVREIAESNNLVTANKKDSTGICFIGERNFKSFLQEYISPNPGQIKDMNNNIIGKHDGLMFYTLGQRKGLNIGGVKEGTGERWFVIEKDLKNNVLYVNQGEHPNLYSKGLVCDNFHFINSINKVTSFKCKAKFRYRQPDQDVSVTILKDSVRIDFMNKQRAITPGQWAVLYDGDVCLGGGLIKEIIK